MFPHTWNSPAALSPKQSLQSSKDRSKKHDLLKQRHAKNVRETRQKVDELFVDQQKIV
jgi:hypothetical protein